MASYSISPEEADKGVNSFEYSFHSALSIAATNEVGVEKAAR